MATFYKRKGARGVRWTARVRIAGRETTKTWSTKVAAEKWARAQETAIDGGDDGLQVLDACLRTAAAHLLPGGQVLAQVRGEEQADAAGRLCRLLSVAEVRSYGPDRAVVRLVHT